jgi:hypothetical protein
MGKKSWEEKRKAKRDPLLRCVELAVDSKHFLKQKEKLGD